jgi:hypothetical protein
MIKVIKHGQKEFEMTCSRCGCEFTYEFEDILQDSFSLTTTSARFVKCPDCGNICYIDQGSLKIGWPTPGEPIPCNIPSDAALNPCKDCDWHKKMTTDGINWYVGDTPCTWCQKNPMKVTCGSIGTNLTTPINILKATNNEV